MQPPSYPAMDQQSEASDTLGRLRDVNLQPAHLYHKPSTSTTHSKRSSAPRPSVSSSSTVQKPKAAMLWSDGGSSIGDKRRSKGAPNSTFYNEDTPPPSPSASDFRSATSDFRSNGGNSIGTADLGYHVKPTAKLDQTYDYQYDHIAPPAPLPPREILGYKRRTFLIAVGLLVLIVVAVAVGVGVGVGVGSNKNKSSGSDAQTSPTATTSTSPTSTTSTSTSSSAKPTTSSSACPAANNTVFDVPNSDKSFLRLCGVDYADGDGAEDLTTVWTASMVDCMTNCAGFPRCEACSWGALEGDKGDNHRCYLKRNLTKSESRRPGWDFAVMQ
ncbi:unnamed protein product [Clonostachys solani]|uniref:Apple domain-containing protein n=1 Tax=Clonostachys solani TaxID=160281 RepID=A0A9N9ZFK9_9HYPO|nr:unnamed protein product [Clonostachys solani]